MVWVNITENIHFFYPTQVLSFTHPVSFHSAETFESLLGCLKMDDEKVAEAALQIFKNTGSKMEESFPHIKSYASLFAGHAVKILIYFPTLQWLSHLLPQVSYCRYCRPKLREAHLARPSMPSTASTPCSPTETHTLLKSLRSVSSTMFFPIYFPNIGQTLWNHPN